MRSYQNRIKKLEQVNKNKSAVAVLSYLQNKIIIGNEEISANGEDLDAFFERYKEKNNLEVGITVAVNGTEKI